MMTGRHQRIPLLLLLALALALTLPASAGAISGPFSFGLETGDLSRFDKTDTSTASLTVTKDVVYEGAYAAEANYEGGDDGYARGTFEVSWRDGTEVWYSAAFYLKPGFHAASDYVALMRWDNYSSQGGGSSGDTGGIDLYEADSKARLMREHYDGSDRQHLAGPFDLPEGRWFWLEVHQRLSSTNPFSEVYLDGAHMGSSTAPNTFGNTIERVRYGIVAASPSEPFGIYFDRATVSFSSIGSSPGGGSRRANGAPTVRLTSPARQARFGRRLSLAATAGDDSGVARVEFYVDGKRIGQDTSAPYRYRWRVRRKLRYGSHRITARAFDADGRRASSSRTACRVHGRSKSGKRNSASRRRASRCAKRSRR